MGKPSEDDESVTEIDVSDGKAAEEETDEDDRGDVVNPEETEEALKKLADEDDADDGDAADEAPVGAKGGGAIPKPRFDEVNEKRIRAEERARLAEEEVQRLRGGKAAEKKDDAPAIDLKDLRKQQRAALMEGDEDKAAELDDKIDAEMERRATERAMSAISESNSRTALADAAAAVIGDFPFLDSKSKGANKEAIDEVVSFRNTYIKAGMSPADALLKAAAKVGKFYAPKKKADADEDDEEPTVAKSKIDELKAARLKKNAAAANAQPSRLDGGVGNRGTGGKLNVADMDEDTFSKLTEKDKARMRGDIA